jgi:hypothetical protein
MTLRGTLMDPQTPKIEIGRERNSRREVEREEGHEGVEWKRRRRGVQAANEADWWGPGNRANSRTLGAGERDEKAAAGVI